MKKILAASSQNTVLDDIATVIGLRSTILLAAWWGGNNIVIPASRPHHSVLAKVIGKDSAIKLSEAWPGEQVFVPKLRWFEEIRKARQVHNMAKIGLNSKEIASVMCMTEREIKNMQEVGRFAAEAIARENTEANGNPSLFDIELPDIKGARGGRKPKKS